MFTVQIQQYVNITVQVLPVSFSENFARYPFCRHSWVYKYFIPSCLYCTVSFGSELYVLFFSSLSGGGRFSRPPEREEFCPVWPNAGQKRLQTALAVCFFVLSVHCRTALGPLCCAAPPAAAEARYSSRESNIYTLN